jgi:hypothetical protein
MPFTSKPNVTLLVGEFSSSILACPLTYTLSSFAPARGTKETKDEQIGVKTAADRVCARVIKQISKRGDFGSAGGVPIRNRGDCLPPPAPCQDARTCNSVRPSCPGGGGETGIGELGTVVCGQERFRQGSQGKTSKSSSTPLIRPSICARSRVAQVSWWRRCNHAGGFQSAGGAFTMTQLSRQCKS